MVTFNDTQQLIQTSIRELCSSFDNTYWGRIDESGEYPNKFVDALAERGWLAILIPEEYGGGGMGVTEACIVLEEIHRSGGNASACHAQMYTMGALLSHGSDDLKSRWLPKIASGEVRLQAFAVTEPDAGSDTTRIATRAVRDGDHYIINGQKTFISRVEHSDLMLLLARTTPLDEIDRKTDGLSIFLIDLREAQDSVTFRRIPLMINHHSYEVFITDLRVPRNCLVGEVDRGFSHVLSGMNAERILLASEAVGDGLYFIDRSARYATERVVFGRPIGANQGVQFPIASAYAALEAAGLARWRAASLFDSGQACGSESNIAKLLASQAAWLAANAAMTTFGGAGFAREVGIERKFRETKLLEIAPVSNNLILAHIGHTILKMPRTY